MQVLKRQPDPLFDAFPGLETERLLLRRLSIADGAEMFEMLSHPELARFTVRKPLQRVADAVDLLRSVGLDYATRRAIRWCVCKRGENKLIATVGLHEWDRYHRHIAIGFDVRHEHWGEGIGTEMVTAVCAYAFDHLGIQRIEAHVMKGNRSSQRLLESIGFDCEGTLRRRIYKDGGQHDVMLYSLIAHDELLTH